MRNFRNRNCERGYCFLEEILTPAFLVSCNLEYCTSKKHSIGDGTLEDVTDGCDMDCYLKDIARKVFSRRLLEQLRCIADYKWILGEEIGYNIGMEEATNRWVSDGFAKVFADVYQVKKGNGDIIRHKNLYVETEAECR